MVCKHCGEVLADGAKFCENCGNKVEEVVEEVVREVETVEETVNEDVFEESYKEPERVDAEVVSDDFTAETPEAPVDDSEKGPQGYSIASLVCGILGLLCCCCGWFGLIVSIAGIVLGVISLNKNCEGRGMAIAGIVCGGIGALVAVIAVIIAAATGGVADALNNIGDMDQISDFIDSL